MDNHTSSPPTCCCNSQLHEVKEVTPISQVKKASTSLLSVILSLFIAFFPKCPLCWAAYMSMFGCVGLSHIPYLEWLLPILIIFLGLHLFFLFKKVKEKGYLPFILSCAGAIIMLTTKLFVAENQILLYIGMLFIFTGSLANQLLRQKLKVG